jgi:uncharacterized protein (DUF2267 family)
VRKGDFLKIIEASAGTTREQAETAVRATVTTLAESITRGEAEEIAAFLPCEVQEFLASAPETAERFGLDEFLRRVTFPTQRPTRTLIQARGGGHAGPRVMPWNQIPYRG